MMDAFLLQEMATACLLLIVIVAVLGLVVIYSACVISGRISDHEDGLK